MQSLTLGSDTTLVVTPQPEDRGYNRSKAHRLSAQLKLRTCRGQWKAVAHHTTLCGNDKVKHNIGLGV